MLTIRPVPKLASIAVLDPLAEIRDSYFSFLLIRPRHNPRLKHVMHSPNTPIKPSIVSSKSPSFPGLAISWSAQRYSNIALSNCKYFPISVNKRSSQFLLTASITLLVIDFFHNSLKLRNCLLDSFW